MSWPSPNVAYEYRLYVVSIFGRRKESSRRVAILQFHSLITSNLPGAYIEKQNGVGGARLIVGTTNSICFALLALTVHNLHHLFSVHKSPLWLLCYCDKVTDRFVSWLKLSAYSLIDNQTVPLQNYRQALWTSDLVESKALIST